ncbi:galactose-specific lectin nattectin-like [Perca fluviatilis]|uniref:galactose-specific lectin nattectin-like n=1 Tax=Perca fluviatilis TaxID=8168 RepID=UPI0019623374|nr:galactose-specific lectin nattectin-like [Perca fluviatilis]
MSANHHLSKVLLLRFLLAKTWIDAETFCISTGGNLASIHSDEEHKFIKDFINQVTGTDKNAWIGGSDAVRAGTWLWNDGSNFNYKSWAAGEPNAIGVDHCLMQNWALVTGWFDGTCTTQASFVCSKNLLL